MIIKEKINKSIVKFGYNTTNFVQIGLDIFLYKNRFIFSFFTYIFSLEISFKSPFGDLFLYHVFFLSKTCFKNETLSFILKI